jgi:hypothetical protein
LFGNQAQAYFIPVEIEEIEGDGKGQGNKDCSYNKAESQGGYNQGVFSEPFSGAEDEAGKICTTPTYPGMVP